MTVQGKKSFWLLATGLVLGMGCAFGAVWIAQTADEDPMSGFELPAELLHATGSAENDAFAIATGPIEDGEGLFLLDFLTGELQCSVINPRTRAVGGYFRTNVAQQLGADQTKKPRYLMVTGQMNFPRGAGARLANCICYVVDANTGNFAAYTLPWNPNFASTGRPQQGALLMLAAGKARNVEIDE